jgi:hypothetical protein
MYKTLPSWYNALLAPLPSSFLTITLSSKLKAVYFVRCSFSTALHLEIPRDQLNQIAAFHAVPRLLTQLKDNDRLQNLSGQELIIKQVGGMCLLPLGLMF